jgi:undecaprenyl diphosphate synthase
MVASLRENSNLSLPDPEHIPRHVAIIMDGNGRWAKARGLPRSEGHRQGTENLRPVLRAAVEFGIEILTVYAFSTENWKRPRTEVRLLLSIMEMMIDRELQELHREGVQLRHIGELDGIPKALQKKIHQAKELTKDNSTLILNIAFNYGGRDEIVRAVQQIIREGTPAEAVTEELISQHMYTRSLPDPDLIIRTSGEIRLSNFLVWQGTYSEFYFTPAYWPDFNREELLKALVEYSQRRRRYGKTDEQLESTD